MGYIKIILVGVIWFLTVITSLKGWYKIIVALLALLVPSLREYTRRIWVADDQDVFTLVGGQNEDHTISGHVGNESRKGKPEYKQAEKVINALFWFEKDHCYNSIEWDEVNQKDV